MAVEYEISSDVAVIKETGSVSQCARVTQMYSGQITYDDEAGSKFATATINGKSQRVMLCIAVNGTVNYDDVPSLYSTVDGHRCLNIVTPTETGIPDDVPSLYETVVIDGQNVRAVRCIMINKTPVYDGVSSTCTFTGDDGKTHTAQLVNKVTGGSVQVIIKGTSPLNLPDAIANSLSYVKAFGGTEQRNLPDGYTQFGRIHFDGNCYFDTGIVINSLAATVKLIAAFDSQTNSSPCMMWGFVGGSANLPRWGVGLYTDRWFTSANATLPYGTADTDKHIFIAELYDNSGTPYWRTYVDGALLGGAAIVSSETITGNTMRTYIGARNKNGTAGNYIKGNFTYLEITQDGACLAKIYPCKRDSDNVLGLYNTVTNEFLPNLGTGTLTADIFASPTPDTPMDIVSNNGAIMFSPNLLDMAPENIVVGKYINNSGAEVDNTSNFYNSKFIPVSPNTTYTWSTSESIKYINFMEYDSDQVFLQRTLIGSSGNPAGTSGTFVTGNDTAYVLVGSNPISEPITIEDIQAINWQFEKGSSASQFIPFGTVYDAGPIETIRVRGNNLLDADVNSTAISATPTTPIEIDFDLWYKGMAYNGYANTSDISNFSSGIGTVTFTGHGSSYGCARFVKLRSNTTYTISCSNPTSNHKCAISCYVDNGDGTYTPTTQIKTPTKLPFTFTTNSNVVYGIVLYSPVDTSITYSDIQLEQGSTATDYEPYFGGGTATAQRLLKLGDYADEQEILSGTVARKIGLKIFDGTESWTRANSSDASGNRVFYITLSGREVANNVPMLCTHFKYIGSAAYATLNAGEFLTNASTTTVYFDGGSSTTVVSWRNKVKSLYDAGTPIIMIYPLATPTTESVAGQVLQVADGDNVLEITQAGMDGLELEAQYDAAVQLTVQEVEDANLDNNVTVTIQ